MWKDGGGGGGGEEVKDTGWRDSDGLLKKKKGHQVRDAQGGV